MDENILVEVNSQFSLDYGHNKSKLCGIPFLRIKDLELAIQLFPVTKIQFEYYISNRQDPALSEEVYKGILENSPRISPRKMDQSNYRNIFITGLKVDQIKNYANWLGEGYDFPTPEDWYKIYEFLRRPAEELVYKTIIEQPHIPQRSIEIINNLSEISSQLGILNLTMADQLFFGHGIKELVSDPESPSYYSYVGGKNAVPRTQIRLNKAGIEIGALDTGFRLIKR